MTTRRLPSAGTAPENRTQVPHAGGKLRRRPVATAELETLHGAAAHLGLTSDDAEVDPGPERGQLRGVVAGVPIALAFGYRGEVPDTYVISARASTRLPARVTLKPAWLWPPWRRRGRVFSGDRAFDRLLESYGPPMVVRALLGVRVRSELRSIASHARQDAIVLRDRRLAVRIPLMFQLRARALESIARSLVWIASEGWFTEEQLRDRLLHNCLADPEDLVRRGSAAALLELVQGDEEPVRLRAYRALATSDRAPMRHRMDAVMALRELAPAKVAPVMEHLARSTSGEPRRLALDYLASIRWPGVIDLLGQISAETSDDDGALIHVAHLLAELGDPRGEQTLLFLLRHRSIAVQASAVAGLGEIGTIRAVMPLQHAGRKLFSDRAVRRAIERALSAIRDRAEGGEPGSLSLAQDPERGAVSLHEEGALSLAR